MPHPLNVPLSLSDLVGEHTLYGVDCPTHPEKHTDQIRFQLGRHTYVATERESDEYRSRMDQIVRTVEYCAGRFPKGVPVVALMCDDPSHEVLQITHESTGKLIVEVGTNNADDYYPCWVARFYPENTGLDLTAAAQSST